MNDSALGYQLGALTAAVAMISQRRVLDGVENLTTCI